MEHQIVDYKVPKATLIIIVSTAFIFLFSFVFIFAFSPDYYSSVLNDINPKNPHHQHSSPEKFDSPFLGNTSIVRDDEPRKADAENCDLFSGEWILNAGDHDDVPYYTNETCDVIEDFQNCMKHGKPSLSYLKWRWKPDACDLPKFDPRSFLQLLTGKSISFIGDSLARNHMQSLICLLSRVVHPVDFAPNENKKHGHQHWVYKDYNFNISLYWSPYLVRSELRDPDKPYTSFYNVYLDEYDQQWKTKMVANTNNYIIISAAHWYLKPNYLYENGSLIGCAVCNKEKNMTQLSPFWGYKKGFRTAFRAINSLKDFKGVTFLRTVTPEHFEGGAWNEGGDCVRTSPFRRNETAALLEPHLAKMRRIQIQELLKAAEKEGTKKRFRLMDPTQAMLLRPDGHPGKYAWDPSVKMHNDCTHWCLPGPVDAWNEILLQLIRREEAKI